MRKSSARTALVIFVMVFASSLGIHYGSQHRQSSQLPTLAPTPPPATSVLTETHNEPYYTQQIANQYGWEAEVVTPAGTRCDLVSELYAIEVEWVRHSYEAVGQSLHYAIELQRKPAILFLLSDSGDQAYAEKRIGKVAEKHGIEIIWYDTTNHSIE